MTFQFKSGLMVFALATLSWRSPCLGQTAQQTSGHGLEQHGLGLPGSEQNSPVAGSAGVQLPDQQLSGSISGTVVDRSGAVVGGARVRLTRDVPSLENPPLEDPPLEDQSPRDQSSKDPPKDQASTQEELSGNDGQFSFANVGPGAFHLTITAAGFAAQTAPVVLHSGEIRTVPQIALDVATSVTELQVSLTRIEEAEREIKVEEKQRVLGAIPNFYVSYVPNAVPLIAKQKFELAWKTIIDPFTFVVVGGAAGVEQAQNHFSGYGQGAQGYAKRFGAGYADTVTGTFIGGAILPSILKQDPRYFYKGTGSVQSRFFYAIANSLICKGDNGHWQVNYSNILGSLAAGGISNLYYPEQDRNGAGLTFENGAIGIGTTAVANLFQEFVVRKLTPKIPKNDPGKP